MRCNKIQPEWRKSSRSCDTGNCVEWRVPVATEVHVRDSKDPAGPTLAFDPTAWTGFVGMIKAGWLP